MHNICKISLAVTAFTILGSISRPAVAASLYSITSLGVLGWEKDEGCVGKVKGINNKNQVVGYSCNNGELRAFLWDNTQGMKSFDVLGDSYSQAGNINDNGQVVGYAYTNGGDRAFLFDQTQPRQNLGIFGSKGDSYAYSINNQTQVVGYSYDGTDNRAFMWDSVAGMQDLGALDSTDRESYAYGINNQGQVVGYSYNGSGYRAFMWDSSNRMQDLGVLGTDKNSYAYAINDKSQAIGFSKNNDDYRAFLWDNTKGMQDLGILGNSRATDINNKSQVVGYSWSASGDLRAFIWQKGLSEDLNSLIAPSSGWTLNYAAAINDAGDIAGSGYYQNQYHAFLLKLQPKSDSSVKSIPESSSIFSLILFAVVGFKSVWRRRK